MNLVKTINNFHYIRVSVVVWSINGTSRINNLDDAAGKELHNILKSKESDHLPIIVDFKGIVTIIDRSFCDFITLAIVSKKEVHFINNEPIKQTIRNLFDEFKNKGVSQLSDNDSVISLFDEKKILNLTKKEISTEISKYFHNEISNIVKQSFIENPNGEFLPLASTPILSTGEYDATLIISNPLSFAWICIIMADTVEDIINANSLLNSCLLSVSLRSSPFANAISLLLNIPMRTIDHLGIFQKVWEINNHSNSNNKNTNFIFIGDFIVGGTELKLAHLFAKYCSSELKYAVTVGSVFEKTRFKHFDITSIVNIKDLNAKCQYKLWL